MSNAVAQRQESAAVIQANEATTVLQVIQKAASDPSCDIEKLERLMAMHERMQAKQAEQQYADAMAAMQQELPAIGERGNAAGRYTYALWEDINEKLKPILAKHGFSISFRMPRCDKGIEVEGVLTHRAGHSERTTIVLPADTSGNKNAVQAVASSVSYGKRYTAGALLNYTTHGEDDDAFSAVSQQPALDQRSLSTFWSALTRPRIRTNSPRSGRRLSGCFARPATRLAMSALKRLLPNVARLLRGQRNDYYHLRPRKPRMAPGQGRVHHRQYVRRCPRKA